MDVKILFSGQVDLLFAGPQEAALLLGRRQQLGADTIDGDDFLELAADLARAMAGMGPADPPLCLIPSGSSPRPCSAS
jgi:hypothetical protein